MSLNARNRFLETHFILKLATHETQLLNEIEQKEKIKIERQYKVFGYKVDGYCHETNTVYEINEPFHYKSEEKIQEDLKRQI